MNAEVIATWIIAIVLIFVFVWMGIQAGTEIREFIDQGIEVTCT